MSKRTDVDAHRPASAGGERRRPPSGAARATSSSWSPSRLPTSPVAPARRLHVRLQRQFASVRASALSSAISRHAQQRARIFLCGAVPQSSQRRCARRAPADVFNSAFATADFISFLRAPSAWKPRASIVDACCFSSRSTCCLATATAELVGADFCSPSSGCPSPGATFGSFGFECDVWPRDGQTSAPVAKPHRQLSTVRHRDDLRPWSRARPTVRRSVWKERSRASHRLQDGVFRLQRERDGAPLHSLQRRGYRGRRRVAARERACGRAPRPSLMWMPPAPATCAAHLLSTAGGAPRARPALRGGPGARDRAALRGVRQGLRRAARAALRLLGRRHAEVRVRRERRRRAARAAPAAAGVPVAPRGRLGACAAGRRRAARRARG